MVAWCSSHPTSSKLKRKPIALKVMGFLSFLPIFYNFLRKLFLIPKILSLQILPFHCKYCIHNAHFALQIAHEIAHVFFKI